MNRTETYGHAHTIHHTDLGLGMSLVTEVDTQWDDYREGLDRATLKRQTEKRAHRAFRRQSRKGQGRG